MLMIGNRHHGVCLSSSPSHCPRRICCCCHINRDQFECFFFWLYTCCFRLSPFYFDTNDNLGHRLDREEEGGEEEDEDDQTRLLVKEDVKKRMGTSGLPSAH